ncbi:UNVERIFIED_CONTAM: DNA-binding response OmpR family regulator [Brevibacillus sp. OAP136]
MDKVLIIEDDPIIGDMIAMYLTEEGFLAKRAELGKKGLALLPEFNPDVVLLDLVLPDVSGMELCSELRRISPVPILVVSMKTDVSERVDALLAGADDFLCKPFSMRELTAKIGAMIRRTHLNQVAENARQGTAAASNVEKQEPIVLDMERRAIYVDGYYVETTFSEFEMMRLFLTNPGKVFSREELINELRGFDSFVTERAIDVHIANLRKKIEENPKEPKHIRTVWGVGYKFVMG